MRTLSERLGSGFYHVSCEPAKAGFFIMKKSFVLYNDMEEVVKELSNEQAGQLLKLILKYVRGEDSTPEDLLLKVVFTPIKLQLDRDADKYDKYIDKQRENGLKGGRPKNPPLTQKTQRLKKEPKKADTVTVTDTVTDNVNETVNVNVSDINAHTPTESEFLDYSRELCLETNKNFDTMEFTFKSKYLAWIGDNWRDGNGNEIKNWKTKLRNTLPYLKPINNGKQSTADQYRAAHEALGGSKLSQGNG